MPVDSHNHKELLDAIMANKVDNDAFMQKWLNGELEEPAGFVVYEEEEDQAEVTNYRAKLQTDGVDLTRIDKLTLRELKLLHQYALTGNITLASRAAGVTRDQHYKLLKSKPVYTVAYLQVKAHIDTQLREVLALRQRIAELEKHLALLQDENAGLMHMLSQ
jgi:hypothetical protein